jgi:hypothetical protein
LRDAGNKAEMARKQKPALLRDRIGFWTNGCLLNEGNVKACPVLKEGRCF